MRESRQNRNGLLPLQNTKTSDEPTEHSNWLYSLTLAVNGGVRENDCFIEPML